MEILKLSTQEIISFKQLRETYYNVAFPADLTGADLTEYDAAVVLTDPTPNYDPATETLELSEPTLIDGQWKRTWTVEAKTIDSVTMRQCRLELLARGLLDAVETAMATLPQEAQIEWEYATQVNRNFGFVAQMATLLEFSEADTDAFFLEASQR